MSKTKSQLRAEAVERLKNYERRKHKNLARCILGDRYEDVSFEANRLMLIDLLTDDAHEARGSYEERLHDVPVSDCPYCGCKRVVIHDFSDIYENPHSYRVEHMDEKEAFNAGCFETYYSFDSVEKAVEHANMRDPFTDEPMDARRDSDGTCPDADGTPSIERSNDGVAKLDAQARAEIEDAERSRAVSGDSGQGADVYSTDCGKAAQDTRECSDDEIVYGFQFCGAPSSTMLGETVFDYNGEPVGWIVANGLKGDFGHDADMSDSRERLEADVRTYMFPWRVDMALDWLDRQAAITQNETIHDYNIAARESGRILRDEIAELKADNDCLRDRNEKLDYEVRDWKGEAKTQRNNFEQATEARKHWQRKYETVKAERDELKSKADALEADKASWQSGYHIDRIAKLQAQRDRYRDLLSKAVDEAQAVVKLMEVDS